MAAACVLAVDKPEGPTSHDVVQRARAALGVRRVGHTGTLDPFASGLLLLCVGRATRLVEYFHLLPKRYEAEVVLGAETSTDDRTGEPAGGDESWRRLDEATVRRVLESRTGRQRQRPPAFSAVRVGGRRRAHELARVGETVALEEREIEVHELALRAFRPPALRIGALVSTGTYVRALARDLGRALGCGAHLFALRRTAIGPFRVEEALDAGLLEPGSRPPETALLPPARALAWLPARMLGPAEGARVREGGAVERGEVHPPELPGLLAAALAGAPVRLLMEGRLVAVAEVEDGRLHPRVVLA